MFLKLVNYGATGRLQNMAEWETIETRKISGKGLLRMPSDKSSNRAYILYAVVFRPPINKYLNFNWNPPKSRYANLTFLRQGYVIDVLPMEYDRQVWDGVNDISGQSLIAIKCAYSGLLESFFKLSALVIAVNPILAATVQPVDVTDSIKDYESLRLCWDEVRVQCYADTAIQFTLQRLKYDVCDPAKDKERPPPPPPPPPPPVLPGVPFLGISPPYEPDDGSVQTGDNGNTSPSPIDEILPPPPPPPPPPPNLVSLVTVVFVVTLGSPQDVVQTEAVAVTTPYYVLVTNSILAVYNVSSDSSPDQVQAFLVNYSPYPTPRFNLISATDINGYPVEIRRSL